MKKILISINPEHVQNIISGKKKYEYRKVVARQDVSSIIIYETSPIKQVVAEAEIREVLILPPEKLWEKTKKYSGISKDFFDKYFLNREKGYAYKLGKVTVYNKPKALSDFGIKYAPQSFIYL